MPGLGGNGFNLSILPVDQGIGNHFAGASLCPKTGYFDGPKTFVRLRLLNVAWQCGRFHLWGLGFPLARKNRPQKPFSLWEKNDHKS